MLPDVLRIAVIGASAAALREAAPSEWNGPEACDPAQLGAADIRDEVWLIIGNCGGAISNEVVPWSTRQ